MSSEQKQIIDQLDKASSILVTVSNDPSVDQLAAAIGLSLFLNSLDKHTTVVFSGKMPSTIEFLKPENTIEKDTDSLRDFIIALDKSKADKLRYKVEDKYVKIFITPYRTKLKSDDLNFSQGEFNVDTVFAVGVHQQKDLDKAIIAHGQILHDATVISVNTDQGDNMGSINWTETNVSSLCELVVALCELLKENAFDSQTATALLTGIVAETDRFSNDKTKSSTMSVASRLMAAGANQQLVAMKLHSPKVDPQNLPKPAQTPKHNDNSKQDKKDEPNRDSDQSKEDDNSLSISHQDNDQEQQDNGGEHHINHDEIHIDEAGTIRKPQSKSAVPDRPSLITEPPSLGGTLTSNIRPEGLDPSTDPLSSPPDSKTPMMNRDEANFSLKGKDVAAETKKTLEEIERSVGSPHVRQNQNDGSSQDDKQESDGNNNKQDNNSPPPVPPPFMPGG